MVLLSSITITRTPVRFLESAKLPLDVMGCGWKEPPVTGADLLPEIRSRVLRGLQVILFVEQLLT